MILSGEKKEEYRAIKPYWNKRLVVVPAPFVHRHIHFDTITFTNGYKSDARKMVVACLGIEYGEGKPEWGAEPGQHYHVISLGKILKKNF